MVKGCSSELPQGQLGSLFPAAQLGTLIVQVGQGGMSGLFCWSLPTNQRAGPWGSRRSQRWPLSQK